MILAHAFGQRYELPIPLLLYVLGGATVVVVSFLLVARRAVGGAEPGLPADVTPVGRLAPVPGALSLVLLAALVAAGFAGSQEVAENILPTVFWLVVWIALPLSCGLIGDWTQPVNPFAVLAKLTDRPRLRAVLLGGDQPLAWPSWLGWWPAVLLFFIAACGELVFNLTATVPANTALALTGYAVISAVGGLLFGRSWLERGEVFTVLFSTWGRLGYFRFGAPGRRRFAGGLDVPFEVSPSRIAFVLLLLISVNFDGLLATPRWSRFERGLPGNLTTDPAALEALRTSTFVVLALVIAGVFGAFAWASARAGQHGTGLRGALAGLLPSLLPIAFGYLLAHNLQYLLVNSQLLFPLVGNPVGSGSWPLHLPYPFNDDFEPHVKLLPSASYWYISVVVIIAVHVIAVVLAHRHLGRRGATERAARVSEYPWLVAMVAYTMLSLWLLAQPLVKERAPEQSPTAAVPAAAVASAAAPATGAAVPAFGPASGAGRG